MRREGKLDLNKIMRIFILRCICFITSFLFPRTPKNASLTLSTLKECK